MIYNFGWSPLFAMLLTNFIKDPTLSLGFLIANIVPCSSMTLGYIGLSGGDLGISVAIVALSYIVAVFAAPGYLSLYAQLSSISLPISKILNSIITVLVLPLILGFITRRIIEKKRGI